MTARTALTPVALVPDGQVSQGAGATPDASNGNTVAAPGPFKVIVVVKNADGSDHTCTVRAGGSGVTASGAAAAAVPFAQATVGDLVETITASTTKIIGPLTTDRFVQKDGSLSLDWSASTSMTVWILQAPYTVS